MGLCLKSTFNFGEVIWCTGGIFFTQLILRGIWVISFTSKYCYHICVYILWYLPLESVSRNTVPRAIFPNTLPREQGVYWIIWSLIISLKNIPVAQQCNQYFPDNDKNSVKMHLNQSINVYLSTTTHRIFQATKADRQSHRVINT